MKLQRISLLLTSITRNKFCNIETVVPLFRRKTAFNNFLSSPLLTYNTKVTILLVKLEKVARQHKIYRKVFGLLVIRGLLRSADTLVKPYLEQIKRTRV